MIGLIFYCQRVNKKNKQFELMSVDPNSNKFKINGVVVYLVPDGKKWKV